MFIVRCLFSVAYGALVSRGWTDMITGWCSVDKTLRGSVAGWCEILFPGQVKTVSRGYGGVDYGPRERCLLDDGASGFDLRRH